jgi:hypothetical protein
LLTTVAKQRKDKHATIDSHCNSRGILGGVFFGVRPRGYITRVFSEPGAVFGEGVKELVTSYS